MKVYLVIKEGVYLQGIYGVYDTLIQAKEAQIVAKCEECDDYHTFDIIQADINKFEYIEKNVVLATNRKFTRPSV